MSGRVLVAYFSASGVTARVAKAMADAVGADVYEIRPEVPYTRADLDWTDKGSRTTLESKDEGARPVLAGPVPDLSGYGTVLLGFPVWWYVEPRIVDSFLDSCDLAGKTVAPFATSGGSGIEKAESHLKKLYPDATWVKGSLLRADGAADWARSVLG